MTNKNLSNNFNNNEKTIEKDLKNMKYKHINTERSGLYNSNTNNISINNNIENIRKKYNNNINSQRSNNIYNDDDSQMIKFKINKIKKIIKEKNIKLGKFPSYQINKDSKQLIVNDFLNKDNNFLNDSLNSKISNNLNLMNYYLNQSLQANYRRGYIKNIINKQYDKNLLNNFQNYESSTEKINANKRYLKFKNDTDKIIPKNINKGFTQRSLIQNINNTTNPYENIEFNILENNNIQKKKKKKFILH